MVKYSNIPHHQHQISLESILKTWNCTITEFVFDLKALACAKMQKETRSIMEAMWSEFLEDVYNQRWTKLEGSLPEGEKSKK